MRPSLFLLFHCFFLIHGINAQLSRLTPLLPPLLPPIIPGLVNFVDERLALLYPIIQAFKLIIILDPLNVTASWNGSDICSYKGFLCDNPPDNTSATTVAGIDFNGFQLSAPTLVGFIDRFTDLAIFHANTNAFGGVLPPALANLQYLYELDISNNLFTGTFPDAVLKATSLTFLDIRYNRFAGSIPGQVFRQNLEAVFLNNNLFMQRVPADLGATPAEYLTFANNKLVGPIPNTIGNLNSTLKEVLFLNNSLDGCVPYEVGFLNQATVFDASENRLTGELPSSLACMDRVEVLSFAGNRLYGAVPEAICSNLGRRKNLYKLLLSDNYFTSVGSECMKLVNRTVLHIARNCISGLPNQRSTVECRSPPETTSCLNRNTIACKLGAASKTDGANEVPSRRRTREVQPSRQLPVTYVALLRDRRQPRL